MAMNTSRRDFVKHTAGLLAMATLNRSVNAADDLRCPTRFITTGPRHHWFGY
ncbi:MAG TPA: twin-arginine translocation signal domain-containing protein, partial [Fuerstia sp.]|nr:twin-arginine translocation signal domain-containing protein [Fuerstiella sp.]